MATKEKPAKGSEKAPAKKTAPKKPAPKKAVDNKKGNNQQGTPPKKKKKRGLGGLIILLLVMVLISLAVVCYLYNLFEVKTAVIGFFVAQDDSYLLKAAELAQHDENITQEYAKLEQQTIALEEREKAVTAKEAQLTTREERLNAQNEELKASQAEFANGSADFDKIVETVSSMSAKNAAEMLQQFSSVNQMALVLSNMEPKAVAKILKEMPAGVAASVTELLIYLSGRTS